MGNPSFDTETERSEPVPDTQQLATSLGILKAGNLYFWKAPDGSTRMYVPDNRRKPDDPQILASTSAQQIAEALMGRWIMVDDLGQVPQVSEVAKMILEVVYGPCRGAVE